MRGSLVANTSCDFSLAIFSFSKCKSKVDGKSEVNPEHGNLQVSYGKRAMGVDETSKKDIGVTYHVTVESVVVFGVIYERKSGCKYQLPENVCVINH